MFNNSSLSQLLLLLLLTLSTKCKRKEGNKTLSSSACTLGTTLAAMCDGGPCRIQKNRTPWTPGGRCRARATLTNSGLTGESCLRHPGTLWLITCNTEVLKAWDHRLGSDTGHFLWHCFHASIQDCKLYMILKLIFNQTMYSLRNLYI